MAKISGIIFVILGVVVSVASYFVNSYQGTNSLLVFIYIGYAFIAYGVAKIVAKMILGKNKLSSEELQRELAGTNSINPSSVSKNSLPPGYIGRCKKCNTPMRNVNVYCHRCGLKQ